MNSDRGVRYQRSDFQGVKRVEVRRPSGKGGVFAWKPGTLVEFGGGGAFVQLDDGPRNFFHFSELRPLAPAPRSPVATRGLATIGDAIGAQPPLSLVKATPPPRAPIAAAQVQQSPLVAATPAAVSVGVAPRVLAAGVAMPSASSSAPAPARAATPKQRLQHRTTAIGEMFRALRLRNRATQKDMSELFGISNRKWSLLELGDVVPTDDLLEHLSVLTGHPIGYLMTVRDAGPVDVEPATQQSAELPADFEGFLELLQQVKPLPTKPSELLRFLEVARELFELWGKDVGGSVPRERR